MTAVTSNPARSPRSGDVAIALVTFGLEIAGILSRAANETGEFSISTLGEIPAATFLLLAISSLALLWRRANPLIVLGVTLGASLVWDVIGLENGPSLAILVALYGLGRYVANNRTSLLGVAGAVVVFAADDLLIEKEELSVVGLSVGLVAAAWYLGRRVRRRGEHLALIEERAEYLERERLAEARWAVEEERTRIARELHDVVAHHVSMMTIQAGAAQAVAGKEPEKASRAMAAVENAGRQALGELRHVVGVLRSADEQEQLVPVRGLTDVPTLVGEMEEAGIDVSLVDNGAPSDLPVRVDLAAYRIIQEALTNVLKHGGSNPAAEVRLANDGAALTIEVMDRGAGETVLPGSGSGLLGMRERALLLGGEFEAGPRPEGGFRVFARLPVEGGSA